MQGQRPNTDRTTSSRPDGGNARLRLLPLLAACAILLSACQGTASLASPSAGLDVVATMSVFADFATQVGGSHVTVTSIVPVGGDPHTYQPIPSDAIRLTTADVVLDNGLGLSPWFTPLETNITGELVVLTEDIVEEATRAAGKIDPHMWMVPEYVADGYMTAIEQAFSAADPDNAGDYADNAAAYRDTMGDLDQEISLAIEEIPSANRKIVTSHDAYSYFARTYGLEVVGTITGVTTEEEPSARTVSELIDRVRSEGVPAIFFETTINPSLAQRVARDADVALGDPLYGDSVGEPGSGASDYESMMRANVAAIVDALQGTP